MLVLEAPLSHLRRTGQNGMVQFTSLRRLFALLLVLAAAAVGLVWWAWGPGPALSQPVDLAITPGLGRRGIAQELAGAGVIRSAWGFEVWSALHRGETLKAGAYRFTGGKTVAEIFEQIRGGHFYTVSLTIPEGYNRFDIAHLIAGRGLGTAAAFLAATADPAPIRDLDPQAVSLEGYLFPATYAVSAHASADQIVAAMLARFRREILNDESRAAMPAGDLHRWVTLASLVEKETPVAAERPLIAGVFENRLSRHMPLQCDPSVVYAALLAGRYTGALHRDDLTFPSPYNTYVQTGLPPGPIANPGRAALLAAAHPAETDFLYFVSTGRGSHRFARTLAEQDKNVRLYLRTLRDEHHPPK